MKKVAIITNNTRDKNYIQSKKLIELLHSEDFEILMPEDAKDECYFDFVSYKRFSQLFADCDVAVTLGGDGTILNIAHYCAKNSVPILGINFGNLGYMTELENGEINCVPDILKSNYNVEKRMMLKVDILKNGEICQSYGALNDAVVSNGTITKMLRLELYCHDSLINTFESDGIIISTPTGSTAYSFSAGGPIIEPSFESFCVTPICSHSVYSRSIVLSPQSCINIKVTNLNDRQAYLTVDGDINIEIKKDMTVRCSKSGLYTQLIRVDKKNFYDILKNKLGKRGI